MFSLLKFRKRYFFGGKMKCRGLTKRANTPPQALVGRSQARALARGVSAYSGYWVVINSELRIYGI